MPTRDSSVGRAGDCSGKTVEISRSAVRLRLAGAVDIFRQSMQEGNSIPFLHCSQKVVLTISEKWPISSHSLEVKERSD